MKELKVRKANRGGKMSHGLTDSRWAPAHPAIGNHVRWWLCGRRASGRARQGLGGCGAAGLELLLALREATPNTSAPSLPAAAPLDPVCGSSSQTDRRPPPLAGSSTSEQHLLLVGCGAQARGTPPARRPPHSEWHPFLRASGSELFQPLSSCPQPKGGNAPCRNHLWDT